MLHLDTSFLIRALMRGSRENTQLRALLEARRSIAISCIAWAEFLCGPLSARQFEMAEQLLTERVAFAEKAAAMAVDLFNRTGRRRGSLADAMIAATALHAGVPLATSNTDDFERFVPYGLTLLPAST